MCLSPCNLQQRRSEQQEKHLSVWYLRRHHHRAVELWKHLLSVKIISWRLLMTAWGRSCSGNSASAADVSVKLLSRFCLEFGRKYENVLLNHQMSVSACLLPKCKPECAQTSIYARFFMHESMRVYVYICAYSKICFFTLYEEVRGAACPWARRTPPTRLQAPEALALFGLRPLGWFTSWQGPQKARRTASPGSAGRRKEDINDFCWMLISHFIPTSNRSRVLQWLCCMQDSCRTKHLSEVQNQAGFYHTALATAKNFSLTSYAL